MNKVIPFERSFASSDKARYWSKKNTITPNEIYKGTPAKYWFDCDKCPHDFESNISNVVSKGRWCPYCSNQQLCDNMDCTICKNKSFASHIKSQYLSLSKNNKTARKIFKGSSNKYWFNCECGHEFEKSLCDVTGPHNGWCPYCSNPPKQICTEINKCTICFDKTFASHETSKYWSKKNKVTPYSVMKHSGVKYWFDCICGHEFEKTIGDITTKNGWCSYCSKPPKQLCNKEKKCKICYEKTFSSHEKSQFWSKKNKEDIRDVFKFSGKSYWFHCDCGHDFDTVIASITTKNTWCPYCSNPPKLMCEQDCDICYEKSFASIDKSQFWCYDRNIKQPRQIFKSSGEKYWFKCNKCSNQFEGTISHITKGVWCPYCVNKTEQKLYDALLSHYPQIKSQYKVEWCKNKTYLPYDFVLTEDKIIIELDGLQHFEQVSNWQSPEETHINDVYKIKCANENVYSVIRLLQTDVFYNTYDWLKELRENIEKIKLEQRVQNVYMCKDNEYAIFT